MVVPRRQINFRHTHGIFEAGNCVCSSCHGRASQARFMRPTSTENNRSVRGYLDCTDADSTPAASCYGQKPPDTTKKVLGVVFRLWNARESPVTSGQRCGKSCVDLIDTTIDQVHYSPEKVRHPLIVVMSSRYSSLAKSQLHDGRIITERIVLTGDK